MKLIKKELALIFCVAAYFPVTAQATFISGLGTYVNTTTASYCPNNQGCTTAFDGKFVTSEAGGELSSSAFSYEYSYAIADAFASMSGASYLPNLRVSATAGQDVGGFSTAFSAQGFTYDGPAKTETLNMNLHGSVSGNGEQNYLAANVAIIFGNDLAWDPAYGTLVGEIAFGYEFGGEQSLLIQSGNNINTAGSISFDLNPGDEFYVIANMYANSIGGSADGWNTLSLNFDDDTGLTAAITAVPVPGAVWLFASGLLGLAGFSRRKK